MEARQIGHPVTRNEDPRLLTGRGLFVDDVELPGLLHAAFLRSPHARAQIRSIDVAAAKARPGVVAVVTAEDLGDDWRPGPLLVPPPPIKGMTFRQRTQVPLAKGEVRHVGEPVVVVVAASRYIAEDAVGDIAVDFAPLPPAVDLEAALLAEAPRVHADLPDNIAAEVHQAKGDYAAARARATHVVKRRYLYDRGASNPIETRGVVAAWDEKADRLTVWDTTQAPVVIRNGLWPPCSACRSAR
jgi:aerobic carbon-monoxide dehydrogenase large subunit